MMMKKKMKVIKMLKIVIKMIVKMIIMMIFRQIKKKNYIYLMKLNKIKFQKHKKNLKY